MQNTLLFFSFFPRKMEQIRRENKFHYNFSLPISKNIDDSKFSEEVYKKYSSILCPFILRWYYFKKIQFLRIECFMRAAFQIRLNFSRILSLSPRDIFFLSFKNFLFLDTMNPFQFMLHNLIEQRRNKKKRKRAKSGRKFLLFISYPSF